MNKIIVFFNRILALIVVSVTLYMTYEVKVVITRLENIITELKMTIGSTSINHNIDEAKVNAQASILPPSDDAQVQQDVLKISILKLINAIDVKITDGVSAIDDLESLKSLVPSECFELVDELQNKYRDDLPGNMVFIATINSIINREDEHTLGRDGASDFAKHLLGKIVKVEDVKVIKDIEQLLFALRAIEHNDIKSACEVVSKLSSLYPSLKNIEGAMQIKSDVIAILGRVSKKVLGSV